MRAEIQSVTASATAKSDLHSSSRAFNYMALSIWESQNEGCLYRWGASWLSYIGDSLWLNLTLSTQDITFVQDLSIVPVRYAHGFVAPLGTAIIT